MKNVSYFFFLGTVLSLLVFIGCGKSVSDSSNPSTLKNNSNKNNDIKKNNDKALKKTLSYSDILYLKELNDAILKDPQSVSAYSRRGEFYIFNKQIEKGERDYQKALEIDPHHIETKLLGIYLDLSKGKVSEAEEQCLELRSGNMDNPLVYIMMARIYKAQGEYDFAQRNLTKSLHLTAGTFGILYELYEACLMMNEHEQALACISEAILLDPARPLGYIARAELRKSMGNLEGSLEDYRKSLELDPANSRIQNEIDDLLRELKTQQ